MKRWVILIIICLLIVAIINVAVAWWFAFRFDPYANTSSNRSGISFEGPGYEQWLVTTSRWKGSALTISQSLGMRIDRVQPLSADEALPYWANLIKPNPAAARPYPSHSKYALAHGWPLRTMMRLVGTQLKDRDNYIHGLPWHAPSWLRGEQTNQNLRTQPIYLPLKIIWPGFAANTLLYAMLFYSIFFLPFKLRYLLRLKRKQCTNCSYPIGQSKVCSECGTQLILKRPR